MSVSRVRGVAKTDSAAGAADDAVRVASLDSLGIPEMLGGRYLILGRDRAAGIADHSAGGLHSLSLHAVDCAAAGRKAALAGGTSTSSSKRRVTAVSPFRVGRGPRAGNDTTFHGHSGGIDHSMAS